MSAGFSGSPVEIHEQVVAFLFGLLPLPTFAGEAINHHERSDCGVPEAGGRSWQRGIELSAVASGARWLRPVLRVLVIRSIRVVLLLCEELCQSSWKSPLIVMTEWHDA